MGILVSTLTYVKLLVNEVNHYETVAISSEVYMQIVNSQYQEVEPASRLRQLRESIFASREDIVRKAYALSLSLSVSTIRNAEKGRNVSRITAGQLLEVMNALLKDAKKPAITLEDLKLSIA